MYTGRESAKKRGYGDADLVYSLCVSSLGEMVCVYCGEPAECADHVQSLTWAGKCLEIGAPLPNLVKVQSCLECNALAGSDVFDSFEEKALAIRKKLRKRYSDILRAPKWEDWEIEELSGATKIDIRAAQKNREKTEARLEWSCELVLVDQREQIFQSEDPPLNGRSAWG